MMKWNVRLKAQLSSGFDIILVMAQERMLREEITVKAGEAKYFGTFVMFVILLLTTKQSQSEQHTRYGEQ